MKIVKEKNLDINGVVAILKKGGLVIFPSETVYGAAVDATNPEAVKRLNQYKKRPFGKPYSIAVSDQKMAEDYVFLNTAAKNIYRSFLPGPVTVVSKGKQRVAAGIESEIKTLGIRIPNYPLIIRIIKRLGKPITATSANASYQKRPYEIKDILDHLSGKQKKLIDLIIDAGKLPSNEPSTVIDTTFDEPVTLRQGEIKLKDKNELLSRSEENTQNIGKELWQKYEKYSGQRAIIFALEGAMGAGKTQFTKGLGRAMGIEDEIISPTYNLVLEYKTRRRKKALAHIDAWRIKDAQELISMGFLKMLEDKNIVIAIEWPEKVGDLIKKFRESAIILWVKINYGQTANERIISWGAL